MGYQNPVAGVEREARTHVGAPAGTSEVQSVDITGTPNGGTFKLSFLGVETTAIAFDANAAAIDAALEALSTIGTGNVAVTGTNPFTVTFGGALGQKALPLLVLSDNSLTGGTDPDVAIAEDTPGVDAAYRDTAVVGTLLRDMQNGELYICMAAGPPPTYALVGGQT